MKSKSPVNSTPLSAESREDHERDDGQDAEVRTDALLNMIQELAKPDGAIPAEGETTALHHDTFSYGLHEISQTEQRRNNKLGSSAARLGLENQDDPDEQRFQLAIIVRPWQERSLKNEKSL